MDLGFTDEQELLRDTLREVLARHSSPEIVRGLEDKPQGFRPELWRELAALDLAGLTVAERHGGAGMGPLEVVVLYEELGRALASTPHLPTCVLGAGLLRAGGTSAQQTAWLPRIARGEVVLAPAWYEPDASEASAGIRATAMRVGDGWSLDGTKIRVPLAAAADVLLVLARTGPDAVDVFLVPPATPGVEHQPSPVLGSDAEFEVVLDGVRLPDDAVLGEVRGSGWAAFERAMVDVRIAVAAYAVGGARRTLELTTAYAQEREQFGRPIGSFQGLAHPIADIATEITAAEVLVHQAAWSDANGRPPGPLPAMAKAYACDVFKRATKVGQQVFGGVGFTRVLDIQLYFRRAKQLEITWGGPALLHEEIAAAELDGDRGWVTVDAAR